MPQKCTPQGGKWKSEEGGDDRERIAIEYMKGILTGSLHGGFVIISPRSASFEKTKAKA